ncbi:hypothetical protein ANTRET_LOCUS3149 [Anthophora retusa]
MLFLPVNQSFCNRRCCRVGGHVTSDTITPAQATSSALLLQEVVLHSSLRRHFGFGVARRYSSTRFHSGKARLSAGSHSDLRELVAVYTAETTKATFARLSSASETLLYVWRETIYRKRLSFEIQGGNFVPNRTSPNNEYQPQFRNTHVQRIKAVIVQTCTPVLKGNSTKSNVKYLEQGKKGVKTGIQAPDKRDRATECRCVLEITSKLVQEFHDTVGRLRDDVNLVTRTCISFQKRLEA